VQVLERPQGSQVEDAAQVHVERVGALAGENPTLADLVHGGGGEVGIVRGAARADVDRRAGQLLGQDLVVTVLDPGQRVVLRPVPVRVAQARDRPRVVQERRGVAHCRVEPEAVGDVGLGGPLVGHVDVVGDVVTELVEVRATVGVLERDEVRDERHRVGSGRTDERVGVGAVGDGVLGGLGCFAVGRHH
jgi:hypothetical protein